MSWHENPDGTRYWTDDPEPSGQPQGPSYTTGGIEPVKPGEYRHTGGARTFDPFQWGGRGQDIDPVTGQPLGGSGAARDTKRYQDMGQNPQYAHGPQIDRTQEGESRGLQMGALDLMQRRAQGLEPSAAEQLGTQQARNAAMAQQSMANSARGGAMARAAAARNAQQQGALIEGRQRQANEATRAGEMAEARGQLFGQTTEMRGQDTGVAGSQADLEMGQRRQNDQREGFYESLAQGVQQQQVNAANQVGTARNEDAAARNRQNEARQANQDQHTYNRVNMGIGGAQGLAGAYGKVNDDNWSDERTKQNARPMTLSPVEAKTNVQSVGKRVRGRANDMIVRKDPYGTEAGNDYDRSMFKEDPEVAKLHRGIEQVIGRDQIVRQDPYGTDETNRAIEQSADRGIIRENPYMDARRRGVAGAPVGYAKSRGGQPGSIDQFKPGPERTELAPGSRDEMFGRGEPEDRFSREIMGLPARDPKKIDAPGAPRALTSSDERTKSRTYSPVETKKNVQPVKSTTAEDDEEIRKFLGLKPGEAIPKSQPKETPEERARVEKEAAELAKRDAEARAARAREDEKALEARKLAYVDEADARNQERWSKFKNVPIVGGFVDDKLNEQRTQPKWEKLERADRYRANDVEVAETRKKVDDWARSKLPQSVIDWADRQKTGAGWRPVNRDRTLSPVEAKQGVQDFSVLPLMNPAEGVELRADTKTGRGFYESNVPQQPQGASLSGPAPKFSSARPVETSSVPKAAPKKDAPKPRKMTDKELLEAANAEIARYRQAEESLGTVPTATREADERSRTLSPGEAKQNINDITKADSPIVFKNGNVFDVGTRDMGGGVEQVAPERPGASQYAVPSMGARGQEMREMFGGGGVTAPAANTYDDRDIMFSDDRTKGDESPMANANRAMHAYSYEYKPEFAGQEGQAIGEKNVGPMAQELEKDPVAATALTKDPQTGLLAIDKSKGLKLVMGGLSDVQRQIDELKAKRRAHG